MNSKFINWLIIFAISISSSILIFALERISSLSADNAKYMQRSIRSVTVSSDRTDYKKFYKDGVYTPVFEISTGKAKSLVLSDIESISSESDEVESAYSESIFVVDILLGNTSIQPNAPFTMVTKNYSSTLQAKLIAGSYPTENDYYRKNNLICLTQWSARRYFDNQTALGKKITLRNSLSRQFDTFTVAAIFVPAKNESEYSSDTNVDGLIGFIPLGSGSSLPNPNNLSSIDIVVKPGNVESRISKLKEYINSKYGPSINFYSDYAERKEAFNKQKSINLILILFSAGGLLVSCITLFCYLTSKVARSSRESAVLMALGASRLSIMYDNILLSFKIGLAGAIIGTFIAVLIEFLAKNVPQISVAHSGSIIWQALILGPALVVIMCGLFGLLPAYESSKTKISEVLK